MSEKVSQRVIEVESLRLNECGGGQVNDQISNMHVLGVRGMLILLTVEFASDMIH